MAFGMGSGAGGHIRPACASLKLMSSQIGDVLRISPATVVRMNQEFRSIPEEGKPDWGGRRHGMVTPEEEQTVLVGILKL